MKRRDFLKTSAFAAVVASLPITFKKSSNKTVEIDTEDGWKEIDFSLLKPGDVFRVKENGKVTPASRAAENPYLVSPDVWGVRIYKDTPKKARTYTMDSLVRKNREV